jgi:hypothetical protein
MVELKLGATSVTLAALSQFADSAFQVIAVAGVVATALLAISSLGLRVWRFSKKVDTAVDLLLHLGDRFDLIQARLDAVEAKVDRNDAKVDRAATEVSAHRQAVEAT